MRNLKKNKEPTLPAYLEVSQMWVEKNSSLGEEVVIEDDAANSNFAPSKEQLSNVQKQNSVKKYP